MTPQEAIKTFKTVVVYAPEKYENKYYKAIMLAEEALEKQIPKKPNRTDWKDLPASQVLWKRDRISCPNCNWELLSTWAGSLRYCYHCGQALDWSDN